MEYKLDMIVKWELLSQVSFAPVSSHCAELMITDMS